MGQVEEIYEHLDHEIKELARETKAMYLQQLREAQMNKKGTGTTKKAEGKARQKDVKMRIVKAKDKKPALIRFCPCGCNG